MKLLKKIGTALFKSSDQFFRGNTHHPVIIDTPCPVLSNANTITWELNQGVEDIVIKDLKISLKCFVPKLIYDWIEKAIRDVFLYLLIDAVAEEELLEDKTENISPLRLQAISLNTIKSYGKATGINTCRKIVHLTDWLKIKLFSIRCNAFHSAHDKPFYLLGDFAPANNIFPNDKINFRHIPFFPLRN